MPDFNRSDPPKQNVEEMGSEMARLWRAVAAQATDIAHSKRMLFLAYVAEGFNEAQALELVKSA